MHLVFNTSDTRCSCKSFLKGIIPRYTIVERCIFSYLDPTARDHPWKHWFRPWCNFITPTGQGGCHSSQNSRPYAGGYSEISSNSNSSTHSLFSSVMHIFWGGDTNSGVWTIRRKASPLVWLSALWSRLVSVMDMLWFSFNHALES